MIPRNPILAGCALLTLLLVAITGFSQDEKKQFSPSAERIPAGSKIYVAPISGGLENFIVAGILSKKVPVVLVKDRSTADYEIRGDAESRRASWTKTSRERALIQVADLKTGEVVLTLDVASVAVDFTVTASKQQVGEGCAKLLKKHISDR